MSKKPKSESQKEKDHKRDLYYRRKYGKSLTEYNAMDKEQGHKCAICRRPPKKLPLAVDHWHWLARRKVVTTKEGKYWVARVPELRKLTKGKNKFKCKNKVRRKAIKTAKFYLLRISVRGLLCWACNTGIRKYFDKAKSLYRAAKYLEKHQKQFDWS